MPGREKLAEFTSWCQKNITGDEKGQAQIFLDRLFQTFGQPGCLDVGGATGLARLHRAMELVRRRTLPQGLLGQAIILISSI